MFFVFRSWFLSNIYIVPLFFLFLSLFVALSDMPLYVFWWGKTCFYLSLMTFPDHFLNLRFMLIILNFFFFWLIWSYFKLFDSWYCFCLFKMDMSDNALNFLLFMFSDYLWCFLLVYIHFYDSWCFTTILSTLRSNFIFIFKRSLLLYTVWIWEDLSFLRQKRYQFNFHLTVHYN